MKTKLLLVFALISTLAYTQTRIATGANGARGVVVIDDYIYTINNDLLRADKNQVGTNNFQTVATGFNNLTNGYNLDALNSVIYIPGGGAAGVRSSYVGGTIPTTHNAAVNTSGGVSSVYIYNNELYFTSTNPNNNTQHQLRKATGVNSHVFVASLPVGYQYIADMTMDGSDLYFTFTGTSSSNGAIYKIDLAAATPTAQLIKSGLPQPWGIHFANDYLYFISSASTGYIRKIHKSGTGPVSYLGQSMSSPRGIDIDGQDIYIAVVGTQPGIYKYTDTSLPCNVNIPDANFKNYLVNNTAINTNGDTEIQCSEAIAFSGVINCSNSSITDLTGIEAFINITELYAQNNSIASIDVSTNTDLVRFNCANNNALTSINVSGATALELLWCENTNSLTNLDVSGATALKHLYSYNGSLTNLNISGTTALETLTIYSNSLTSLDISTNLALRYLYCNNNSLTSLDTSSNIDLREIECQNNSLTNFNVANGNNTVITNFSTLNNPNLTCIIVDDVAYSNANWGNIDTQTSFSTNCTPLSVTYVNHTATGNNDGTSWANAYTDLQSALANANNSGNEIWVAKGTYKPSVSDRDVSFVINNNIYGGFAGTEANLADRDISLIHTTNATILSGDLLNDDDTTVNFNDTTRDDNSKHVVEISFNNLEINGLTVKDGYADATSGDDRFGGGIFKLTTVNTTTIKNCIIKNNVAFTGAGLALTTTTNSNIIIDACIIENNLANAAAGLDFHMSASNKTMNIVITNTLFKGNKTDDDASKNRKGSGASAARLRAYFAGVTLNADIVNNTFANNSSLGDIGSSVAGNFPVIDLTKNNGEWNNITVANNIFWSNVTHSNQIAKAIGKSHSLGIPLQGTDSQRLVENNTDEDNLSTFTSTPLNTSSVNPNLDSNFELTTGSPAINTGDNTYVTTTTDLLGNQRIFNTTVDRGAYEFGSAPLGINNFFVEDEPSIYPNPTTSVLNIKMKNDLKQATVYSVLGAKVLETTTKTIHTSQLKPGMYLIKIESKTGNVTTKRFIKR